MAYGFVLGIGLLGIIVYLTLMYSSIPGAVDERLGPLEPLPPDLNRWTIDADSAAGKAAHAEGLIRETRHLQEPGGLLKREHLVRQVRYRSTETSKVVRVEPEIRQPRRRKPPSSETKQTG